MFLERIFIKNYKDTSNPAVRFKYGMLAGFFGLITNILLFVGKIVVGIIGQSITVIADAINNMSDSGNSIVTMFGFKMSSKPADSKHPYGYARYEYITALFVALIVLIIGVLLGKESVEKIISPAPTSVSVATYVILAVAIALKLYQFLVYRSFAKKINSESLKAMSVDSINDTISTFAVLAASLLIDFLPDVEVSIDGICGLLVSLLIVISSIKLVANTVKPLLGEKPPKELVVKIRKELMSYNGVLGIHDLMIHNYGEGRNFVMVHVEVDSSVDVMESHELIDEIEQDFKKKMGIHLSVHMDPIDVNNPLVKKLKEESIVLLSKLDDHLSLHDFRIIAGPNRTSILFDVVLPFFEKHTQEEITDWFKHNFVGEKGMEYNFVIDIDRDYVSPPSVEEQGKKEEEQEHKEKTELLEQVERDLYEHESEAVDKKEDNDELLKKAEKEQKEIEEEKAKQDKFFKL